MPQAKTTRPEERILDPTKEPSELEILFAAGFYEGEGCCERGKNTVTASSVQKDPEILYRLRDWFGGNVVFRNRAHWKGESFGKEPIYRWRLSGDKARVFLQTIYPYLSARRKAQIFGSDAFRFTGVVRDTHKPMSPERIELRKGMTRKQKMVESQIHYREQHREMVMAYQREQKRVKYQREKVQGTITGTVQ